VHFHDTVAVAFRGVLTNKSQAFLTALGIIIGVASVTLMQSMGTAFQTYILEQVNSIGTKTMGVAPKGIHGGAPDMNSLTYDDFMAIKRLPTVTNITPAILVPQKVEYGRESTTPTLIGGRPPIFTNYGMKLDQGRLLDDNDEAGAKPFAVVAHQTAKDLFGDDNPIGKRVTVGSATFTVIGVLREVGSPVLKELENAVVIPYSQARVLTGKTSTITFISLQAVGDVSLAIEDVTQTMRQQHQINNPGNDPKKDDFEVRSTQQAADIFKTVSFGLTLFLSLIAGISLLVGGIGIMNIMLVSVLERTREVGLRKAVGARKRDILLQFLFEALCLTVAGGVIGLALGAGVSWFLSLLLAKVLGSFPFIISPSAIILSMVMAVGTGLVFGIVPAKNAADLNPIEALRYE
jgi:putative ABC transport system permease protein